MGGKFMIRPLLIRTLSFLAVATVFFGNQVAAEPITVTSGVFAIPDDDVTFFRFFGADGFALNGGFVPITISTQRTCQFLNPGCPPGTVINLSAVAGGTSQPLISPFTLGVSVDSTINGKPFFTFPGPQGRLAGTFRFDAPSFVLPPVPEGATTGPGFNAPFTFEGEVRGFSAGDVQLSAPLFDVELVGQGTVGLGFDTILSDGSYTTVEERFNFSATPEPTSLLLFSTGLAAAAAEWKATRYRLRRV
jgi:hypothetical protein